MKRLTNHVDKLLRDAAAYAEAAFSWSGDAIRLQGAEKESGQPLDLLFYGDLDDVYEHFVDHLYSTYTVQQHVERMPVWRGMRLLADTQERSDVVVGHLGWPWYRAASRHQFLHVPPTLVHKIALEASWEAMEERFRRRRTTKDHLARLRKYQLTWRVTREPAQIETFYDTMYLPHALGRHGEHVQLEPRDYLIAVAQHGGLLQVMQGDRWLAGSVLHSVGRSMQGLWLGLADDLDPGTVRAGLVGVYYLVMQYAITQGCNELNLMYSPPLLNDGIFRFKCKLGSRAFNEWPFSRLVVRTTNLGPAVVKLFGRMPLAVVEANGQLGGRALVDRDLASPADVAAVCQDLTCDGIERLAVYSMRSVPEAVRLADYSQVGPLELYDLSSEADPSSRFSSS